MAGFRYLMGVDLELAIETGKVAFAPVPKPVVGPMSEYCLYFRAPKDPCSLWVRVSRRKTSKGFRCSVHDIALGLLPASPFDDGVLVTTLAFGLPWIAIGDLTFVHPKGEVIGADVYSRAMHAIKRNHAIGGTYSLGSGDLAPLGVVIRVAIKEARLPAAVRVDSGRLISVHFCLASEFALAQDAIEVADV